MGAVNSRALFLSLCIALTASAASQPTSSLKLATWNLEWLIAPENFRTLRAHCAPKGEAVRGDIRRLPCDVAFQMERGSGDFRTLARYAKQLNADVIALQEVDGPNAARKVFEGYSFCFTKRVHLQNNGFAIRPGIPFRCAPDVTSLSLGSAVRSGAEVILYPGERQEIRLLSVHLKSGCAKAMLNERNDRCRDLARQVPALEAWIDAQAAAGRRFAVLGDFNRNLLRESGKARSRDGQLLRLWPEIDDADPPGADLMNTAQGQPFINCVPGHGYTSYIDFIVMGRDLGMTMVPGSFERVTYLPLDAQRMKLSDHCPVAVRIAL